MMSLIWRHILPWWDARGLEEQCSHCGRKSFYCSKLALLNDDDNDNEETFREYIESAKQLKKIRRWEKCQKEGFHGYDNQDIFPLDIDGYFYDSFSYDSTDFLSWLTHLILVQWLNSFLTLFPHISYHSHNESIVLSFWHPCLPL